MKQSLCPYTVKPLAEISNTNGEHILPRAFGSPESFTVPADEAENIRMNDLIDSPAINDPLMRLLAASQGVKSRSGSVSVKLEGIVTGSGEEVIATLGQEGIDFRFAVPVDVDENGSVKGVRGFGDAAQKLANQVQRDNARKGRKMEVGETVSQPNPHLSFRLAGDLNSIHKEIRKIAYLMTVRVFGDEAIQSRSGKIYRAAIHAETEEEIQATGLGGGTNIDLIPTLARAKHNEHALTCFRIGATIVSAVILFGSIAGVCITPAEGFSAPELTGEVVIINATTSTLASTPYDQWRLNFVQTPEFMPAMGKAASMQEHKT